eukprot:1138642-Pelagomonas_calceolata.AAC.2
MLFIEASIRPQILIQFLSLIKTESIYLEQPAGMMSARAGAVQHDFRPPGDSPDFTIQCAP